MVLFCASLVRTSMLRKIILLISLLIISPLLNSCATQVSVLTNVRTARNSFVKVEAWVGVCSVEENTCAVPELYSMGSGAVVFYANKKAILTAAHVCDLGNAVKFAAGKSKVILKAIDREGKVYETHILKINAKADICLLNAPLVQAPALKVAVKKPEYGEIVYNISSPLGMSEGGMVPVFQGLYFGENRGYAHYSIPTIGGSSGSPILNVKGELVGMIHSVHYRFHHISLSATHTDLWNFLESARSHTSVIQSLCLHSSCEPIHIEGFLQE